MTVFLRWGIFGILAVAGILYAYNASKRLAETRQARAPAQASVPGAASGTSQDTPVLPVSADCEAELEVAELALEARRKGETFDRLLRNQQIAFVNDDRERARLANVARRWFEVEGDDPTAAALRTAVAEECRKFRPAP